jgi:hypothetical protein
MPLSIPIPASLVRRIHPVFLLSPPKCHWSDTKRIGGGREGERERVCCAHAPKRGWFVFIAAEIACEIEKEKAILETRSSDWPKWKIPTI